MFWVEFRGWSNCDSNQKQNQTWILEGPGLQEQRIGLRASDMFCVFGQVAYDPGSSLDEPVINLPGSLGAMIARTTTAAIGSQCCRCVPSIN